MRNDMMCQRATHSGNCVGQETELLRISWSRQFLWSHCDSWRMNCWSLFHEFSSTLRSKELFSSLNTHQSKVRALGTCTIPHKCACIPSISVAQHGAMCSSIFGAKCSTVSLWSHGEGTKQELLSCCVHVEWRGACHHLHSTGKAADKSSHLIFQNDYWEISHAPPFANTMWQKGALHCRLSTGNNAISSTFWDTLCFSRF